MGGNFTKKLAKKILYNILIIRLFFLKIKHFVTYKIRYLPVKINQQKNNFIRLEYKKYLLQQDLSDQGLIIRIKFLIVVFSFILFIIIIRLFTIASGEYGASNQYHQQLNHHSRYDITDRNDNLLATNLPISSLYVNPLKVIDKKEAIEKLLSIFPELSKKQLAIKLASKKHFQWIKRDITPQEQEKIYNLGMPAFAFEKGQKRIYPYGNLLAHIIGYVSRDLKGLAGMEKYLDQLVTKNKVSSIGLQKKQKLQLSIDLRVQNIIAQELAETIKKFNAKGAAAIMVDPNNGEIIALVNKPDFNPYHLGKASSEQLFNMVTQGTYEMGSSVKSLTMAIGLDTGVTSLQDAYNLTYMKVAGYEIKDYPRQLKGWHSVPNIFLKSSNIGIGQIILETGKVNFANYLRKLGLLDRLNIELPERARPLFPNYAKWDDLTLITMSYGYGLSQSPAHFMQAMLPVINGGILHKLSLIKQDKIDLLQNKIKSKKVENRIFKAETSQAMRKLLRLVVAKGTGRKAEIAGYYIGGKTGTANIADRGKYDKNRRLSSFFGIIPATKPQYMLYIMYNEPKGIKETYGFAGGGWVAAPSARRIFSKIALLYGLKKLEPGDIAVQKIEDIEYEIYDEA